MRSVLLLGALLIAPVLATPATAFDPATNLILNGSFETKASDLGLMPEHWSFPTRSAGQAAQSDIERTHGEYSLALAGASYGLPFAVSSTEVRTPTAECGVTLTFAFKTDVLYGRIRGILQHYDVWGQPVRSDVLEQATTSSWVARARTVTPPTTGATLGVTFALVGDPAAAAAFVDDVRVTSTPTACPPPPPTPRWSEDWEDGLSGWTMEAGSGASSDCSKGAPGCSLHMAPPCCPGVHSMLTEDVSIPLVGTTVFETRFLGSSTAGDTDTIIQLRFDTGYVNLEMTGPPDNTRVAVFTEIGGFGVAGSWSAANAWYTAKVFIDSVNSTTHVKLYTPAGSLVGTSPAIPYPASTTMTGISVQSVQWTSSSTTHNYDTLRVW